MRLFRCLIIICIMLFSAVVFAEEVSATIVWKAPTTNEDGTPLTDLLGFRIYNSGVLLEDVGNVTSWQLPIQDLQRYTFTAYDDSNNESIHSEKLAVSVGTIIITEDAQFENLSIKGGTLSIMDGITVIGGTE